jgi:hypothetical protein
MLLYATTPPVTEAVPVRVHGTDAGWPPVLVFCVLLVVAGGIVACVLFLRRARDAARGRRGAR